MRIFTARHLIINPLLLFVHYLAGGEGAGEGSQDREGDRRGEGEEADDGQ
jgi:hypothetical protein